MAAATSLDAAACPPQMLGMGDTAVWRSLRSEAGFADVPIIAFTAHALRDEHDQALRDGFDAVIAKPCLPDDVIK